MTNPPDNDWKLKLRYGKLQTPYQHFTVLADGCVNELRRGFECPPGRAWMSMKAWALSPKEAVHMIKVIGYNIGFTVDGKVHIYDTEPEHPPGENAFGYDIQFTPYDPDAE